MKTIITLAFAALMISGSAYAQKPTAKDIKILDFEAFGTGCPEGSQTEIKTNSKPGSKSINFFQVVYDEFDAATGKDIPPEKLVENCDLTFDLEYPEGYQIVFDHIQFEGSAELGESGVGLFESNISEGVEEPFTYKQYLYGPFVGSFAQITRKKMLEFKTPCEGEASIRIENIITILSSQLLDNIITVDTAEGLLEQTFQYRIEKCD